MADDGEAPGIFLERTSRSTRGKRMTKLLGEELEADEEFWGQDAFREIAEDVEYEAEEEVIDEFDSDFDEDEANAEEEEAAPEEIEKVKKKRILPPGSKVPKKDKKKSSALKAKGLDVIEAAVAAAVRTKDFDALLHTKVDDSTPVRPRGKHIQESAEFLESFTDNEGEKSVRKSTRTAVVVRQAEREALRAAMQATAIKPVKKKREGEKRITQEDMLLEAAQTEILNQQQLERMLAHEEEVKQKAIIHKNVYNGPQIRFYSRGGKNFLEFIGPVSEPQLLFRKQRQGYKGPQVCAVTGLPAKYLDPLTGLPYATIEAFKMIRKRVSRDNITQRRALGRNLRSPRLIPGRSSVQKARKSSLCTFSGAKFRKMEARINEAAEQQYVPEALPSHDTDINFSSRPVPQEHSPHESNLVHSITVTPSESSQEMKSTENQHPSTDYFSTQTTTAESQKEPLWVDIPPPKEGPNDDVYLLEDLTSLDFGPILAHQHDLMNQSQRDDFNIADPRSEGAFLSLNLL